MHIHSYAHTYVHTHVRTFNHRRTQTYAHAHIHTYTHAHVITHICTRTLALTRSHACTGHSAYTVIQPLQLHPTRIYLKGYKWGPALQNLGKRHLDHKAPGTCLFSLHLRPCLYRCSLASSCTSPGAKVRIQAQFRAGMPGMPREQFMGL